MHKKGILLLVLIAAVFLFLSASIAQQTIQAPAPTIQSIQKISSFSADLIMLNPQGVVKRQVKIYITPSKIRMSNVFPTSEATISMIFRRDIKVRWMLNSANKTYLTQPLNEAELFDYIAAHIPARSEKIVGTQVVSGFTCSIKTVETTASFRGSTKKILSTIWVSPRLDIAVRIKHQDGSRTELRNVTPGPLQDALFELPAAYTRVAKVWESWGY